MRYLFGLLVILLLVAAGAYVYAGRQGGPTIDSASLTSSSAWRPPST